MGRFGKAIKYHEKILDSWEDADTGIAEVEESEEEAGFSAGPVICWIFRL